MNSKNKNHLTRNIIKKWYKKLGFPDLYDEEFETSLSETEIADDISIDTYDLKSRDGKKNLLSFLYLCEEVEKKYSEKGLPEEVLIDTLRDIVTWCITWSNVKGELYLGELLWLKRHLSMTIFKLGRLQYAFGNSEMDIPKYGISKGDPIIEVHIPEGDRFTVDSCNASFALAREFFKKHFPEYEYKAFTCHSWLLDDTLKKYLPEESGIIRFGNMFDKIREDESWALLRYLFLWDTTPLNLKYRYPASSLAAKVQKAYIGGEKFHETFGVII